ncbi:MAG TPA: DNA internalization-related competence protein ComEC/Rec2, partial [Sporomusaceae bacterium]|nr:DNA internalization-related competence protein ComEC/Rec2 [Sporomusaceae bacterium]
MGITGLWAVLAGREKSGAGAMALAALLMLVWQPALLYDISFQLSFGATAGLVFLYSKTTEKLRFLPKWLASAFAVTFAAQAGIIPFLAWYFHSFSISSFIANIIVIPIIELVIILGLLACISSLVLPLATKLLLVFCSMGIGLAVMLNKAIAAIEGLQFYVPPFGMLESLVFYVLLAWSY